MTIPPDPGSKAGDGNATIYHSLLKGTGWVFLMRWGTRGIGLVSTLILARLLTPEDFGIVAMGTLLVGFLNGFLELGAESLLIREREATRAHCDTAWTIRLIQGAVLALLLVGLAVPVSDFFGEPRLVDVIYLIALSAFIEGFDNIGMVLVRKELDFAKDFRFGIYNRIAVFLFTVLFAFALRSYWALVIGQLAGTVFTVINSYFMHSYRPRLSRAKLREYLHFSISIIPLTVSTYLTNKLDVVVVGRIGGTAMLGAYNVASELSSLATREIVTPLARALYPNFARIADDPVKLVEVFRHVLSTVAMVCTPIGFGLWVVADDFVLTLLGPHWRSVVPLLQWLSIYGVLLSLIQVMNGHILIVTGNELLAAVLGWVRLAILAPIVIYATIRWGPEGAAAGMVVSAGLALPITGLYLLNRIQMSLGQLFGSLWRPVTAALVMAFVVDASLDAGAGHALRLGFGVVLGVTTYVVALLGLWALSGRPAGMEGVVVRMVAMKLRPRAYEK